MPNRQQPQLATPPAQDVGNIAVQIPTTITLKDVVVIVTALLTIVSSWTFYTMRLSVVETKNTEMIAKIEKVENALDLHSKEIQELKMKDQAFEIRYQMIAPKK